MTGSIMLKPVPLIVGRHYVGAHFKLRAQWQFMYCMANMGQTAGVADRRRKVRQKRGRYTVVSGAGIHPRKGGERKL